METQSSQNHPHNIPSAAGPVQENIFSDVVDTAPYDKSLRNARIWLYVIAGIQAAIGVYEYVTTEDKNIALIAGGIDFGIAMLFVLFAVWSYKQPAIAFLSALIAFVLIHVGLAILDPANIARGIILKILVVIALVKAYNDARQVQKLRESVGLSENS